MGEFTTISNILGQYGWGGLIGIGSIIALFFLIKYLMNRQSNKITSNITKVNDKLIEAINKNQETTTEFQNKLLDTNAKILEYFMTAADRKHERHDKGLDHRMKISSDIYDMTREILYKYHANRVAVLEFHNNSENLNGLPFLKFDMHYENVEKDTLSIQSKFKDIGIENISAIFTDILDEGYVVYESIDDLFDRASSYCAMLKEDGIHSVIYVGLYNSYNKVIGLLTMEYHEDIPDELIDITDIKEHASKISTLLELRGRQ